jgi:hypothetical protein
LDAQREEPMSIPNPILLLGAGFSKNWGGPLAADVFDYLLGSKEISANPRLRELLWKHQFTGGFEDALAELQDEFRRAPASCRGELEQLQLAIARMFDDMNRAFAAEPDWEFQQDQSRLVRTFLARFNALFTLNQDLLLEQRYLNDNVSLSPGRKWNGYQLPGTRPMPNQEWVYGEAPAARLTIPDGAVTVHDRMQPIFKLHGSSNWREQAGGSLLVMGGNKARAIRAHPLLNAYMEHFEAALHSPGARLMVIGYGFRDDHINEVIGNAVARGLRFYLVDPTGPGLARALNPTRAPGHIAAKSRLEEIFEAGLMGSSRKFLSEIFGKDGVEHAKLMRFFDE